VYAPQYAVKGFHAALHKCVSHWVPRQLVAFMATFGTQFFTFKCYHCHLFTKFVMLKTNKGKMKKTLHDVYRYIIAVQTIHFFIAILTLFD